MQQFERGGQLDFDHDYNYDHDHHECLSGRV
jgi:hypothetical protein